MQGLRDEVLPHSPLGTCRCNGHSVRRRFSRVAGETDGLGPAPCDCGCPTGRRLRHRSEGHQMNLERLAAFRGEAWARRVLRQTPAEGRPSAQRPWPGKLSEARRLAGTLGRPQLIETLAAIIQQCASATWSFPKKS